MGRMYGYARVSTKEQNLGRQLDAFRELGIAEELVFIDKASGKDFDRPGYKQLVEALQEGDVLVVKSIDRLGRNYDEILDEWRRITKELRTAIVVIDMPILDTREKCDGITGALISDIVLQLLSYVAHIERDSIRQRQAEGIAAAKARGVQFGRPKKERPVNYFAIKDSYLNGQLTRLEASRQLGVSISTFCRWLKNDLLHKS